MLSDYKHYKHTAAIRASADERCIGLQILRLDSKTGEMMGEIVGVLREYRGRGIARVMVALSTAYARACGASKIVGVSTDSNTRARGNMERLGIRTYAPLVVAHSMKLSLTEEITESLRSPALHPRP